ncbi:MAG: hypothetical protein JXQ65_00600 [Candidatus Marinimicrobia bacterium]|nr:hypothetical protein [Candidatus Neomarinimicrobiota bacterium]
MDENFKIPAGTFLTGFFLWLTYIILHGFIDAIQGCPPWVDFIICLVAAGLIVFSAYSCKTKGGPRIGAIVRSSVLAVIAGVTFWQMGLWSAIPVIFGAILVLPLSFMKYNS